MRFALVAVVSRGTAFAAAPRIDDFRTATPQELAMESVPFAPGASAVTLNWVQRRDDVAGSISEYVRIKVLTDEGKKYGDIKLPFIPDWRFRFEARLTKPDGTIVPFTGKTYDKLYIKTGGFRLMEKTFSIPDVQKGSIIEYRSEINPPFNISWDWTYSLQGELPIVSATLWLRPSDREAWLVDYRRLPANTRKTRTRNSFELDVENIPPFEEEAFALPANELKPIVNFFYTRTADSGDNNHDQFWLDEGNAWTSIAEEFISGDVAPIHEAAQNAAGSVADPEARLRKLYEVAQKIRNLDYEGEKTEAEFRKLRENRSAQDVLRNGYGTSTQINRLFIALARSAGFEAHAVRIGSRAERFFTKTLPVGSQLNSEVAVVILDKKEIFVDAGTPTAPFGTLAWQKAPVPGMKLFKKQEPVWIETPGLDASCAQIARIISLKIDGATLKANAKIAYQGQDALVRRLAHYADDDAATKKSLEDGVKSLFPDGSTVSLASLIGMRTADPALRAEYDLELPNSASFAGSRIVVPMPLFQATRRNPFAATTRKSGVYNDYPSTEDDAVTLEIPPGYSVETMPAPTQINAGAIVYQTQYRAADNKVYFTRHLTVNAVYIPVDKYPALRAIYSRIAAADQEQIVLRQTAQAAK